MEWLDNLRRRREERRASAAERAARKKETARRTGAAKKHVRAALCLGGGGARGYAHIGAIRAFEEAGIDFDMVVGCSVGSVIGALYAAAVRSDVMMEYGRKLRVKDIRRGFILSPDDPAKIGKIVSDIVGDIDFSDLKKPFYAVATDLVEGAQVIMHSGSVAKAVSASSCVPLFFRPVVDGEKHLVDGGLLNNIPADVCRMMGADFVVTVDVNPTRGGGTKELGLTKVLKATFDIMGANSSVHGLINSDVIIAPDLSGFKATDNEGLEEMFRLGYEAAAARCPEILAGIYNH